MESRLTDMTLRQGSIRDIDLLIDIDNDASMLFEQAGLRLDAARDREITLAARRRWLQCLGAGTVLISVEPADGPVGFAAVGERDGEAYLDQLSVRMKSMGQGLGTELLNAAMSRARGPALWLTTYDHLSWNRAYYQRHGFVVILPEECGSELQGELSFERRLLPDPEHRVAMRRALVGSFAHQRLA